MSPPARRRGKRHERFWRDYELEVVSGLEEFAEQELRALRGVSVRVVGRPLDGRIAVSLEGEPDRFFGLRTVVAIHLVQHFDITRPRALLGQQNFDAVLSLLREVLALHSDGSFTIFRVSAAGADSPVFRRFKEQVATSLGLTESSGAAHLQVAVRRPPDGSRGWQVLVRLSPKPLAARDWRVCDYPGALNATVAAAMVRLAEISSSGRFLNLCCGSGTLMIERLNAGPAALVAGIDSSSQAVRCAEENLQAAGHSANARLLTGDAGAVPMPSASFDELVADLPFGMLVEAGDGVERVHHAVLQEATRLAAPGASFVAITVRKRLFESALDRYRDEWERVRTVPVQLPFQSGYIDPVIYSLRRTRARP